MVTVELQVEWWPIDKIRPYAKNPRKIPPKAIAKVASSIKEFGWRRSKLGRTERPESAAVPYVRDEPALVLRRQNV